MRRNAKRDLAEPAIVEALRKCGYVVYRALPTDLLIHHPYYGEGMFKAMEIKSAQINPSSKAKQEEQHQFLVLTGTKIIRSVDEALIEAGVL